MVTLENIFGRGMSLYYYAITPKLAIFPLLKCPTKQTSLMTDLLVVLNYEYITLAFTILKILNPNTYSFNSLNTEKFIQIQE